MNTSTLPYNCVILDDEVIFTKIIERYISNIENLELKGSFTSPVDAMAAQKQRKIYCIHQFAQYLCHQRPGKWR
jgi:two-component SAPR family response regulator